MTSYQKLILENQVVLEELNMECQEKINEDMAYALSYLSIYNNQLNVPKMHREMNNLMIIYGLSDMIYRGMTLVKFYAPNGVMLSEILHSCFCSHYNKTDVEVQQELGIGRTSFHTPFGKFHSPSIHRTSYHNQMPKQHHSHGFPLLSDLCSLSV